MTKDLVLRALGEHPDEYVSGARLGAGQALSRTAVWKAVEQLREEGYVIDSLPRRGYRLSSRSDVLSGEDIRSRLIHPQLQVRVFPSITSTNTVLKQMAVEGAPAGLALAAGEQTAGRGRLGRDFYSPAGTGLYLSLLLRPRMEASQAIRLTACAAVAAAEALESLGEARPGIKWVNDLYLEGRKVCGILTEAGLDLESGGMSYVVVGIGINTRIPVHDFPEEIRDIAGAVFGDAPPPDLRNRLAAGILNRLWTYAEDPGAEEIFEKYRQRSLVPGQRIRILRPGAEPVSALALDLERDFALRVRLDDGREETLRSGEISIRPEAGPGA